MLCLPNSKVRLGPSPAQIVAKPVPSTTYVVSSSAKRMGGRVVAGGISVSRASVTPSWPARTRKAALHSRSGHGPTSTVRTSSTK